LLDTLSVTAHHDVSCLGGLTRQHGGIRSVCDEQAADRFCNRQTSGPKFNGGFPTEVLQRRVTCGVGGGKPLPFALGNGIPSRVAVDVPTGFRTGLVVIVADRYDVIDKELVQPPLLCSQGRPA